MGDPADNERDLDEAQQTEQERILALAQEYNVPRRILAGVTTTEQLRQFCMKVAQMKVSQVWNHHRIPQFVSQPQPGVVKLLPVRSMLFKAAQTGPRKESSMKLQGSGSKFVPPSKAHSSG